MHQENSSPSAVAESLGQTGAGKLERVLLASPGFFVIVAGIVFLTRSLDPYSICDASLMFLIGIGWIVGCRKIAQLEGQVAEAGRDKQQLQVLHVQTKEATRESAGKIGNILLNSPAMMGAVELDGERVIELYENTAGGQFFDKLLGANGNPEVGRSSVRSETIHGWLKRYHASCWIKTPVSFEEEYATQEGSRWMTVTVSQTSENGSGQQRFCYVAADITEKKNAQKALAQGNEQLTDILDHNPDTVFFLDTEWRVTYLNLNAIQTLGHGKEITGRVFWEIYPELVGGAVWNHYSLAMADRIPVEFDVFHAEDVRYQVRVFPCRGGLAIFLRNVTPDRQVIDTFLDNERQLRRRLTEVEALYQKAPMGLAVFDKQLRFVRINDTLADLNGVRIEATLGRTLGEIIPYVHDQIAPLLQHVMETGESAHTQFAHPRRAAGEAWRYCLTNAYPVTDDIGTITGVSLMLLDTTAEQEAELAVRESEHRFRQLAEALPEIVWTADAEGNIDYCNARWYSYTQCAGKEALSQWCNFIHPADLGAWRDSWSKAISAGEACEIEYQSLRHDGVYRWFLCRAQAVYNSNRQVVKWFGTCTDIHQHKCMELVLRRSNDDLKQLTAAATNDLQEYLRNVTGFCQLAVQYRGQLAAEADNCLETIIEAAAPMNVLLQDLRSYAIVRPELEGSGNELASLRSGIERRPADSEREILRVGAFSKSA